MEKTVVALLCTLVLLLLLALFLIGELWGRYTEALTRINALHVLVFDVKANVAELELQQTELLQKEQMLDEWINGKSN